jgi:hypothetical protein
MGKTEQEEKTSSLMVELLALNAQFEAARAGEAGAPFARKAEAWIEWLMSECSVKNRGS